MNEIRQLFLQVTDLQTARRFYEDGIGLTGADHGETSVSYRTGQTELKLQADFEQEVLAEYNLTPPSESNRGTGAVMVLAVKDALETVSDRVKSVSHEVGGMVIMEPRSVPWGGCILLVEDPDGYVWEICESGTESSE